MANISRKISRSVSRIISRGLGSTIASYFARFFTEASTWVGELLKSSVGDLTLEPTGRWSFEGDGTGFLRKTSIFTDEKYFKCSINVEFDVSQTSYKYLIGYGNGTVRIDLGMTPTAIRPITYDANAVGDFSSSTFAVDWSKQRKVTLEIDSRVTDVISIKCWIDDDLVHEKIRSGIMFFDSSSGLFVGSRTNGLSPFLGHKVNDVKLIDANGNEQYHFTLDNYKSGSTPSIVEYPDVISGAKATLVNGAPAVNLSARTDVGRSNNLMGFRKVSEEYYSPAQAGSPTLDVEGLPLTNPPINNGLGYNGCEQTYRCPDIPKEKDQDDIWKSADGLTVYDVDVGTLNAGDNGNIEIVKDAQGNVSDLKIK